MATNYYFYDAISPLKDLMQLKLGFSSTDYGVFVSAYTQCVPADGSDWGHYAG
jgi:hypothetical protein